MATVLWTTVCIARSHTTTQQAVTHGVWLKPESRADLGERLASLISVDHLINFSLSGSTAANLDASFTQNRSESHVTDAEWHRSFSKCGSVEVMRFGREHLSFAQPDSPQGIGTWPRLQGGLSSSDRLVNPLYAFDRPGKFREESRRVHSRERKARRLATLRQMERSMTLVQ